MITFSLLFKTLVTLSILIIKSLTKQFRYIPLKKKKLKKKLNDKLWILQDNNTLKSTLQKENLVCIIRLS